MHRYEFEHAGYRVRPFGQRTNNSDWVACAHVERLVDGEMHQVSLVFDDRLCATETEARDYAAVCTKDEIDKAPSEKLPF